MRPFFEPHNNCYITIVTQELLGSLNMYIDTIKLINLVSLKNIDIWPIYGRKSLLKYQLFHIRAYVFWP